ncbi:MAG TPA: SLC13 family permease [Isosphaeraceae bacterium]|nr:SLC13 family permease [Isosphaeraceae bacterium]
MHLKITYEMGVTLAVLAGLLYGLVKDKPADVLFVGAVVLLAALGVIAPDEAFAGFANSGMLIVAALFVVAAGLRETGVMDYIGERFLGHVETEARALFYMAAVLIPSAMVLNNTPKVALLVPVLIAWCRKRRISPSRLLMPLSFLSILGGTCSLIGTSTNLVVQGLLLRNHLRPMGFFEIGAVGLPCAVLGAAYLLTIGRTLLPDRKELIEQLEATRREYLVEMLVQPGCRLVGKTIAGAGLRHLPGLFLIEIDRDGEVLGPVGPDETVQAHDRLIFTGIVSTIVDLEKIPGLVPAADARYEVSPVEQRGRQLCETVISPSSPLVGQAVRDADFRSLYDAAIVAVHRNGARLTNKVGDIRLHAGDTLLLQVGPNFSRAFRNNPDFYLISDVEDSRPVRYDRAWFAAIIFLAMITAFVSGKVDIMLAAFLAAGAMVAARCISPTDARKSVDLPVLIAIAASFGVGRALEQSGVAKLFAGLLVEATRSWGPTATLAAIYFGTMVLNELISNNAAAALSFPFCLESARLLGVNERPFIMAVTLAASYAFASPIGYQTHMMVFGPGGYRFTDFMRVGIPLNLLMWIAAVVLIPWIWPFHLTAP